MIVLGIDPGFTASPYVYPGVQARQTTADATPAYLC